MSSLAPNHTTTSTRTGFVDGPSTRGTLNIVWTCLSVLLLCTWSVLHLNVPPQRNVRNRKEYFVRMLMRFFKKVKWMIVNLLAPEWSFGKALLDLHTVRLLKELKCQASRDGVPWSNKHTYFANMGGFGIKFSTLDKIEVPEEPYRPLPFSQWEVESTQRLRIPMNRMLLRHANACMKHLNKRCIDVEIDESNWRLADPALHHIDISWFPESWQQDRCAEPDTLFPNLAWLRTDLWILDAPQLLVARKLGIIDQLPHVTEDDLEDRNKGDIFFKILVIGQICWFIMQVMTRLIRGVPTSQLEVMTLGFCIVTGCSYFLVLEKPKDVQHTLIIPAKRRPRSTAEMVQMAIAGPHYPFTSTMRNTLWIPNSAIPFIDDHIRGESVLFTGCAMVLAIFGIVHCIGWNFTYPSDLERAMWQACSVITIFAIPVIGITNYLAPLPHEATGWNELRASVIYAFSWAIGILFFVSRVFILVEAFRSLAFLPPEAFMSNWTNNFPHIS